MASNAWWFELTINTEGKAHKPQLKSGKLPSSRKLDNGTILAEIVGGKRLVVTPEEVNSIAFATREDAVGFWNVVVKKIALPKRTKTAETAQPNNSPRASTAPESKLLPDTASISSQVLVDCDDDDELIGGPTKTQIKPSSWIVFVRKQGASDLEEKIVTELGKDVRQMIDDDIVVAENGTFPSGRLLQIAFVDQEQKKKFVRAYKAGVEKRKKK